MTSDHGRVKFFWRSSTSGKPAERREHNQVCLSPSLCGRPLDLQAVCAASVRLPRRENYSALRRPLTRPQTTLPRARATHRRRRTSTLPLPTPISPTVTWVLRTANQSPAPVTVARWPSTSLVLPLLLTAVCDGAWACSRGLPLTTDCIGSLA